MGQDGEHHESHEKHLVTVTVMANPPAAIRISLSKASHSLWGQLACWAWPHVAKFRHLILHLICQAVVLVVLMVALLVHKHSQTTLAVCRSCLVNSQVPSKVNSPACGRRLETMWVRTGACSHPPIIWVKEAQPISLEVCKANLLE